MKLNWKISNYLYNELQLKPDIEIAHRVGVQSRNSNRPCSIVVKFIRRPDKSRKLSKGSGISISDDLTARNVRLIKHARTNERIEAAWS